MRFENLPPFANHIEPPARNFAVAIVSPEVAERWETTTGIAITSFYGSMDAGQLAVARPSDPRDKRWATVGKPHDRAEWKIAGGEISHDEGSFTTPPAAATTERRSLERMRPRVSRSSRR